MHVCVCVCLCVCVLLCFPFDILSLGAPSQCRAPLSRLTNLSPTLSRCNPPRPRFCQRPLPKDPLYCKPLTRQWLHTAPARRTPRTTTSLSALPQLAVNCRVAARLFGEVVKYLTPAAAQPVRFQWDMWVYPAGDSSNFPMPRPRTKTKMKFPASSRALLPRTPTPLPPQLARAAPALSTNLRPSRVRAIAGPSLAMLKDLASQILRARGVIIAPRALEVGRRTHPSPLKPRSANTRLSPSA
jgi:hypothetical protein